MTNSRNVVGWITGSKISLAERQRQQGKAGICIRSCSGPSLERVNTNSKRTRSFGICTRLGRICICDLVGSFETYIHKLKAAGTAGTQGGGAAAAAAS